MDRIYQGNDLEETEQSVEKMLPLWVITVPLIGLIGLIVFGLILPPLVSQSPPLALEMVFLMAAFFAVLVLRLAGVAWQQLQSSIVERMRAAMPAFFILLFIVGCALPRFSMKPGGAGNDKEIDENEIYLNEIVGIDNATICNEMFPEPFATCCWVTDDQVFVDMFYNYGKMHYHLIFDIRERQLIGDFSSYKMTCNLKNFPYKSFYSDTRNEIYSFYRQGQAFLVNTSDSTKFSVQTIIEKAL